MAVIPKRIGAPQGAPIIISKNIERGNEKRSSGGGAPLSSERNFLGGSRRQLLGAIRRGRRGVVPAVFFLKEFPLGQDSGGFSSRIKLREILFRLLLSQGEDADEFFFAEVVQVVEVVALGLEELLVILQAVNFAVISVGEDFFLHEPERDF